MSPSPTDWSAKPPAPARDPARVVVVVPRRETRLHEYLQRSLSPLKNVEVVLDRRAASVSWPDERRRRRTDSTERQILMCSLVRCPAESTGGHAASETPSASGDVDRPRTLLWPDLRLENL